ncbi:hypothetical protein IV102_15830 [bacterium]|nr:hypothetical protein [bacterium]
MIGRLILLLLLLTGMARACEHGSVAACNCGCGGTPRPVCAHRDCVCAKSGLATPDAAQKVTASCQCGCGGSPRAYCGTKGCVCGSTNLETGKTAPTFVDNTGQESAVAKCSCGCGGTPRPTCAYKECVCAKTQAATKDQALALAAKCQCGCGGTPRAYCGTRGCVCGSASLETGKPASFAFQDPMLAETKACQCGCGGTPRPTCAYKDCVCAKTQAAQKPPGQLTALSQPVRLVGDGQTTAHTTLELHNPGSQPVAYQVNAFTQFAPDSAGDQCLCTTEEAVVPVAPGATVQARLDTCCSDSKSKPPPGADGGTYRPTSPPAYVEPIVTTARQLAAQGAYDGIPMTRCKALSTVQQLSLWSVAAEKSSNPADQVSKEGFRSTFYEQLGKKPEEMTEKQKEQVDRGIDNLFNSVDLTMKKARAAMH